MGRGEATSRTALGEVVTTPLRFEAEAECELEEATRWYEEQRPGLGERFLHAVDIAVEQIRQLPAAGAPVRHVPASLGVRQVPVDSFPYCVVYLCTPETIRVLAVAHYRRRPDYWLDRK